MLDFFDIYLLEAMVNGILLGGLLALLALGLNLIFGVIDVTLICYAELVMIGMYGMYYMVQVFGLPYYVAAPFTILLVAGLGALLHWLVIAPLLSTPPINQLFATGGVLFVLQSFATVAFGIDFRNLGIRMPVLKFGEMHFSYSRLLAFAAALIGMLLVYFFMKRTYVGTAIRAISQDRQIMALMGVDTRRLYLITSALGGALAGLASCLLVLQYDVHPFVGLSFGPITFLICVLGGLGNFIGGFIAAFVFAEIISLGGLFSDLEWGYVLAFAFFIAYPCFRFRITGHYFVLVTLALSGIVLQVITATRDYTGGSLGYTPDRTKGSHLLALQFDDKATWYLIALAVWAVGLVVWRWVDRSMDRYALEAISEDEDAAAAAGVNVTAEKLKITVISALMTSLAGALYCQYQMFISPDTVSGISVSLQMVFAVIVGGLYVSLGPTVGAAITILLAEILRIGFGTKAVGWDNLVYGVLLVVFIIFLPKGILGSILDKLKTQRQRQVRRIND